MVNYEQIAAEAAELAHQFWLEIEAGFTQQTAQCQGGRPDRTNAVADTLTIGRDSENDIVLESITVSRYHALLLRNEAGLLLFDLESTNGTLLNGVPVRPDEPVRLANGDVMQLGEVVVRYAAPLVLPERPRPAALGAAPAQGSSTGRTP
ncbi:MAG TPA: FHA domain-containing protein [Roseiflexaceae bacterium]|jgi:pSer/pThr/pTyr-binding forkhead associated (FHA) protein